MSKPIFSTIHGPFYRPSTDVTLFDLLDEETGSVVQQPTTEKKCTCSMEELLFRGCQCGGS